MTLNLSDRWVGWAAVGAVSVWSFVSCHAVPNPDLGGGDLQLWYQQPAASGWRLCRSGTGAWGAMVFGGASGERIQFNEDPLWSGGPHDYAHHGAVKHLPEILRCWRRAGSARAEQLAAREFMSVPLRQFSYQPFGDVRLSFPGRGEATDYRRGLDLDGAVAWEEHRADQCGFELVGAWGGGPSVTLVSWRRSSTRAAAVERTIQQNRRRKFRFLYPLKASLTAKIEKVAREVYGAEGVDYNRRAETDLELLNRHGFDRLPICMAKTAVSLSDNAKLRGCPGKFRLTVNELRVSAGAGFVVVIAGNIMTMPGLPRVPAARPDQGPARASGPWA